MERTERIWGIHDPHIFQDDQTGMYYVYSTEGKISRSKDLVHWDEIGMAVKDFPKEATAWTGTTQLWAPDIIKVGKEYRLYCSNSAWGVRKSCIFLAVANRPEGPFRYRGIVVRSEDATSPCNAIDGNPIVEDGTGRQFLSYGSFWGGIYMTQLDPKTGLSLKGPDEHGHCIAARPNWMDAAIEGPYIVYNKDTQYYYLFVSYGSLLSDYNIRVGRSKKVTGPYVDMEGRDLAVPNADNKLVEEAILDPNNEIGYLLFGSFLYENRDSRWHGIMGPGHNSVLHDQDGSWYLVHHARPLHYTHGVPSFMQIRKIYWLQGWPVVAPVMYAGDERVKFPEAAQGVHSEAAPGNRVEAMKDSLLAEELAGIYQFLEFATASPQLAIPMGEMVLYPDGTAYYARTIRYTWEITTAGDGSDELLLRMKTATKSYEFLVARGYEDVLGCETIYLTGLSSRGNSTVAVKLP